MYDALKRSKLTITVKDDTGQTRSTSCECFEQGALVASASGNEVGRTGMPLDCTLAIGKAGRHTLTGAVAWDSVLVPSEAKLEVRREKRDTK